VSYGRCRAGNFALPECAAGASAADHPTAAGSAVLSAAGAAADVRQPVHGSGRAWPYRWMFWEAGLLGQVLYLEAEAAGARGTSIGCYFDDAARDLLGLP
jgi:hypothetical protein